MMTKFTALLAILMMAFAAGARAEAPTEIKGAQTVNAEQVIDLITKQQNLVVLDNRKQEDFASGHIEGAVRLLDTDLNAESLAKVVKSKDTPVLFYCNGLKCGRAAKAAEAAMGMGYTKIYYYALGMEDWKAKGLPLVKG